MTHIRDVDRSAKTMPTPSSARSFLARRRSWWCRWSFLRYTHIQIRSLPILARRLRRTENLSILLSRLVYSAICSYIYSICVALIWSGPCIAPCLCWNRQHTQTSAVCFTPTTNIHISRCRAHCTIVTILLHHTVSSPQKVRKTFVIKSLVAPNNNSHRLMRVRRTSRCVARAAGSQCVRSPLPV